MAARRTAAVLAAIALATAGCRIDVAAEAALDVTGGGELAVVVRIDGATLRELDALGVDPGLVALAELDPTSGWRTSRSIDADGGLVLAHRLDVADGAELAAALGALDDGLAPDDPALRIDLTVATGRGGAVELAGTAGFSPPGTTGLLEDGVPVGPSGAELAALTADAVHPVLRLRVPGPVRSHDGDRLEGRTVTWVLPVGDVRPVGLSSAPAAWWRALPAAVASVVAAVGAWWWRRRRGDDAAGDAVGAAEVSPAG
jgi:hypothetical protein